MRWFVAVLVLTVAGFGVWLFGRADVGDPTAWQEIAMPGELSEAHAFLKSRCSACHSPIAGVEAVNCIVCHANDRDLLERQPTAFHASISECASCHVEHQHGARVAGAMDHNELARIGLSQLEAAESGDEDRNVAWLVRWVEETDRRAPKLESQGTVTPLEGALDCYSCHQNEDRHQKFFGEDCSECHSTTMWSIAEFRHPSAASRDCAQCHQAPPSHYMQHFKMISMKVAGVHTARVEQCFLCHQTTAWTDIKRVGTYKHH